MTAEYVRRLESSHVFQTLESGELVQPRVGLLAPLAPRARFVAFLNAPQQPVWRRLTPAQ